MIWIIFIGFMILSMIVSQVLKSRLKEYAGIPTNKGMTGKDVAEKMLHDNGINDVQVTCIPGQLTDHYNPATKTVNLSEAVYHQDNVGAAAVAAHECGHALQHATAYHWLTMRSKLVPVTSFASKWVQWVILAGILLVKTFPNLLLVGIVLFAVTTLFSLITLPVEINASQRALAWLAGSNITTPESYPKAQKALRTAAYTYVIAALLSLATLFYYIMIYSNRR